MGACQEESSGTFSPEAPEGDQTWSCRCLVVVLKRQTATNSCARTSFTLQGSRPRFRRELQDASCSSCPRNEVYENDKRASVR